MSITMIEDHNTHGLMNEIAGALLAVPLVFLLYEYVNHRMSSNVNDKMAESLVFDVNSMVLKVLKELRDILMKKSPLSWGMINKMLRMRVNEIRAAARITNQDIALLKTYKKDLNELSYKLVRTNVLSERQIQMVIAITKQLAHVVNEWEYKGKTPQIAEYMEKLLLSIDDWFDSCERESLRSHQQFQLTIEKESQK
jgi:predicted nucleic acid-binding protein